MNVVIEQLIVSRCDVPGLDFAAQVLVKHRRKKEVVRVTDKRDVHRSGQLESREHPPEAASENQNFSF